MQKFLIFLFVILFSFCYSIYSQEEMTEEEWQKQMDSLTLRKNQIYGDIFKIDKAIDSLKTDNKKLDSLLSVKKEEMYKILKVNSYQVSEYKEKFWDLYNRIENRIGDYTQLKEEYSGIYKSRIRLLYEFRKPLEKMKENLENFYK